MKSSHRPPVALQGRDLQLLRIARDHRLITTPQFLEFLHDESREGIYRRLQKLFHHGYLDRLGTNPNAPLVYALGRRGADTLDVRYQKGASERYIAHQLMIGDFRIGLELAARRYGIAATWRHVPPRSPIKPDGFFSLQFPDLPEGRNRAFFFLEADRSTMTCDRFRSKLYAYTDWRRRGGHTELLGIKNFRILIVTRSEARLENLARVAETIEVARPIFWFAAEARLAARDASLTAVWTVAGLDVRQNLLPPSGWMDAAVAPP